MAIFHLNHRAIGKATHRAGFAAAHVKYILRDRAATQVLGDLPGAALTRSDAARWLTEREQQARANGRVADRLVLALPLELEERLRADVVRAFVRELEPAGRVPWIAAIHDSGEDADNPHAHLMLVDADRETGKRVLMMSERGSTERLRTAWESVVNRAIEREGLEARVDRRSLAAQGLERIATIHVGPERARPQVREEREHFNAEVAAANAIIAEAREAATAAQEAAATVERLEAELRAARRARDEQREDERRRELERVKAEPGCRHPERTQWQRLREQLLSEAYATDLVGSDLARYWRISRGGAGELVFENAGGLLVDVGERVVARDGNEVEIRGLLDVAQAKGWEAIEFTGDDDFKRRAMAAAVRREITVFAEGEDRRLFERVEGEFREARRRSAKPAQTGIGNRYAGVIEAIDGDVVLQRIDDGELVAHDRTSFDDDRADELEHALGLKMEIGYEYDGWTLAGERDLGIER